MQDQFAGESAAFIWVDSARLCCTNLGAARYLAAQCSALARRAPLLLQSEQLAGFQNACP